MTDIATISLKADTSDLERGTQKLKEFGSAAEKVNSSTENLNEQMSKGVSHQKKISDAVKRQRKDFDDLLDSINPTNKAFQKLDEWQAKLASAGKKGLYLSDELSTYNKIIEQTRDKLIRVEMSLTAEGQALLAQEAATKRAEQAANDFLQSLKNQSDTLGKTRTEILELKAAQMGVSQQAAPMIAKLKEQEKAFLNGSVTIGQYKQAMRQLPMQMTDIVTSLASGMPVWMVMIQQGGQIKDSFGGVGNSLKALTSLITPARVAMFGIVGAASAVALAAYQGSKEFGEFNKQLILTGGYAGKTASQLDALARNLSGNGITQHGMADAISKVVGSGSFSGSAVDMVSKTATAMEKAVGQSVDETIKQFQKLKEDPVRAVTELDKSLHFLTATQLEQIMTLQEQGKEQDAAKIAMESYANAMQERSQQIKDNLGYLESAWEGVKEMASGAWDAMLNIGRERTLDQQIREYEEKLVEFQVNAASKGIHFNNTGQTADDLRYELGILKEKKYQRDIESARENGERQREEKEKERLKTRDDLQNKYANKKMRREVDYANLESKKWALTKEEYEAYRKEIDRKHADPRTPKTPKGKEYRPDYGTRADESANEALVSLQSQLKVLKEHKTVSDVISAERKKLWDMEAKISIIEEAKTTRKLTKDEQALLAKKEYVLASQRSLAIVGDEIELQKQKNSELDKQNKYIADLIAKGNALEEGAGLSSRLQQRKSALNQADTPDKKKALEDYYAKEDSIRANWELGVQRGFAEFQDKATDVYGNVSQISQSFFQGMSNSLSDFVITGKASLGDFTRSFLEMTTKMLMQMTMLQAMKSAFGGTAVGSFLGFAGGGYTGDGGKHEPKGVVHGGEFVFDKDSTTKLGVANLYRLMASGKKGYATDGQVGGSQPMTITQPKQRMYGAQPAGGIMVNVDLGGIHVEGSQPPQSSNSGINSQQFNSLFESKLSQFINKEGRDGGSLDRLIRDKTRR